MSLIAIFPFDLAKMWYRIIKQSLNMTPMDLEDTESDTGTKFHWLFLPGQRSSATAIYDRIILETENFAVLPTKGSIVPGWVLVVPKFPTPRMADVPEAMRGELGDLVNRICSQLEVEFGTTFTFEHGGLRGSAVSCGVDQAHLHIVPLAFDLIEAAELESPFEWSDVGSVRVPHSTQPDAEYWFVSSSSRARLKTIDHPCSQFFRRIIARKSGEPDLWDYRHADFVENIAVTLNTMCEND